MPLILIWGTGALFGLTPFRIKRVDYIKCYFPVKDVIKVSIVVVIGTNLHKFVDIKGNDVFLLCVSYHLKNTDVQIFYPQTYQQMYDGNSKLCGDCVIM